jgi:Zn-dependent protease
MLEQLFVVPILLFSVVIHEMAHGWMALRFGDPTARDSGRLTLNPIPHIDLFGSILVPLFSILAAGRIFIAWAKPVPVNPYNFRNFRRDDMLVSLVGPVSNLCLALACSVMVILLGRTGPALPMQSVPLLSKFWEFLLKMFYGGVYLNVVLAVFNLIPIPPLDGSHVLASFLPDELADRYRRLGFLGIFFVIMLMRVPAVNAGFGTLIETVFSPFHALMGLFLPLSS